MKKWTQDSPGRFVFFDNDADIELGYVTKAEAMAIPPMFLSPNQKWRGSYTTVDGNLAWRWFEHKEDAVDWVEEFVLKTPWVSIDDIGEGHPLLSQANKAVKVLLAVKGYVDPIIGFVFRQHGRTVAIVNMNLAVEVDATHVHPLPPLP